MESEVAHCITRKNGKIRNSEGKLIPYKNLIFIDIEGIKQFLNNTPQNTPQNTPTRDYETELENIKLQLKLIEMKRENIILNMKLLGIYDYYNQYKQNLQIKTNEQVNKETFLSLGKRPIRFNPKVRIEKQKESQKPALNDGVKSDFKTADDVVNTILAGLNTLSYFTNTDKVLEEVESKQEDIEVQSHDVEDDNIPDNVHKSTGVIFSQLKNPFNIDLDS